MCSPGINGSNWTRSPIGVQKRLIGNTLKSRSAYQRSMGLSHLPLFSVYQPLQRCWFARAAADMVEAAAAGSACLGTTEPNTGVHVSRRRFGEVTLEK